MKTPNAIGIKHAHPEKFAVRSAAIARLYMGTREFSLFIRASGLTLSGLIEANKLPRSAIIDGLFRWPRQEVEACVAAEKRCSASRNA
jgi:hypothetical protein